MKKIKWTASARRKLTVIGLVILSFTLYAGLLISSFSKIDSAFSPRKSDKELAATVSTDCNDDENCHNEDGDSSERDSNDAEEKADNGSEKKNEKQENNGAGNTGRKSTGTARNSKCSNIMGGKCMDDIEDAGYSEGYKDGHDGLSYTPDHFTGLPANENCKSNTCQQVYTNAYDDGYDDGKTGRNKERKAGGYSVSECEEDRKLHEQEKYSGFSSRVDPDQWDDESEECEWN